MQKNQQGLAWVASSALFMQTLDATILNTALPAIAQDLQQSPLQMQLAVISYALTVALFIPLSGWLADRFGTLRMFHFAIVLFVLGSVCCAMAWHLDMLVASRVLQGLGGALLMPTARLSIIKSVPRHEVLRVWNMMVMAGLIGPIMGPVLGGWLVTYASWHWIFLINIPIGILGLWLSTRFMPNLKSAVVRLDWRGFVLFGSALVGLTLGLDMFASSAHSLCCAGVVFALGLILLLGYYAYASRVEMPLLSFALFRYRTFAIGTQANLMLRLCGSGVPFLLPLMLQVVLGYSAQFAGWLLVPIAVSSILSKPLMRPLLVRLGYRTVLLLSTLMLSVSLLLFGLMSSHTPLAWLLVALVLYGVAMSMLFTATNTLTISEFTDEENSEGATLLSVTQQVGLSLGIAFAAVVLNIYLSLYGQSAVLGAFHATFFTVAGLCVVQLWIISRLKRDDGANMNCQKMK
ncbi:DHA2 family efflux MFS transporter permease subunit [Pasteurellaceae bacterium HPA106]|uniref:DHA2 family efflux MFS transporter permease subunit n=1 Tax=Spirabiliibacterium pneumoniae TaxID=221400 RepID=UPI001AAD6B25|nr:DHA2 family efflux MFS transporter permease subunit [Spirabiliibacterium pneumoniae]MBE2896366.1 DHA2 family efflux MFS transporter permease subunit [Spirabiliibacterium pneumoniae]